MDFTLQATTVVDAPPAEVFERITDIDHLPDWNTEISRVVERPLGLEAGGEWVVEIRAFKLRWRSRSRVVEVDPQRGRFAYRSRPDNGNPSYADWSWDLVPDAAGTRVTLSVAARPLTFWRKALLSRLRRRGLQRAMEHSLQALHQLDRRRKTSPVTGLG